jgi:hypothetical protein
MRYLSPVLIVLLLISVIANGVMYLKFRSHRAILSVDAANLSKYDLDTYLESIYGVDYKAVFVRRALIHDAAVKARVAPTDAEVNQKFQEAKQLNWTFASTMNSNPWLADEGRKNIQENMELNRLRAKDIPVTDDDIRDEYNAQPAAFDTVSKAEAEVALLKNGLHTNEIVKLIGAGGASPNTPGVKPAAIMSSYRGEVRFLGDNYVYTFIQHYGTPEQSLVFNMKPGDVKMLDTKEIPDTLRQAGYTAMVVRLNRIIPGHKADLKDPGLPATDQREVDYKTTHENLRLAVALKRANPPQELIRSLYQAASPHINAEEPTDIDNIKLKLFPPEEGGLPGKQSK